MNNVESRCVGLVVVVAFEASMVAGFHWSAVGGRFAIDWSSPAEWFDQMRAVDAVVAVMRTAGLGLSWYLLVSTLLYAWVHWAGWSGPVRVVRRVTLPVVRRAVEGVAAVSIMTSTLAVPAVVAVSPAMAQDVLAQAGEASVGDRAGESPEPDGPESGDVSYSPEAAGWPSRVEPGFWVVGSDAAAVYTVAAGDHFWSIAQSHLVAELGRSATEDEVYAYWGRLVEANRSTIGSRDPNLILPGEFITLVPIFADTPTG